MAEYIPRRKGTIKKYLRVQARYEELYQKQRMRLDDAYEQLMREFFIESENTLTRILRAEVEEPPPPNPNQLVMFAEPVTEEA